MNDDIKRIDIAEFRRLGFIQEINRKLLHPCGLALEVNVDEDGNETLGGVWDSRDDPEGMIFGPGLIDAGKAHSFHQAFVAKAAHRRAEFGWHVQPLEYDLVPDGDA